MKSFLYTAVAVAALLLGGVFTSTASAAHGHHHHGHHSHIHHPHSHHPHVHHHHGHYHGVVPHVHHRGHIHVYPYGYGLSNGIYLQGRNFGFRIGF